ncbi:MAG: FAD-dependent pyridine nucleotide-disulfide oxidoreductase, thioredoxin reductase (NADPH) [Candidatus Peregrinibacteria bacterium GW2011_GWF2_43_17]|nr:MAG: FAD-dependent pyridine nucleotide-disulfide oxidoreductase, thioredoxin reductase (NADPH) [Candidatus Peregrinibacteria bacterium GW2011_GWF2_43_17]KKT18953.1 MAG: Thioredoxin reductase (TrxB) [Candidatus Peregrinibacteria bacterium GW2011_GWA2_43_8]HAU40353.1 thioredoxin-disulfide reductase [Candidatus Peregrinibacteria bacterium]
MYQTIIIGGGVSGLGAAIYAKRFGLNTLILSDFFGGTITKTHLVENYPGFKSLSGFELAENILSHAKSVGAEMKDEAAKSIEKTENGFKVTTDKNTYESQTIIFATGTHHRKLGVKGEEEFANKGVSYCATCDGPFFRNKIVAVVGGSDSSVKESIMLAGFASKVYIIYRGENIRPEPINRKRMEESPKIEVITKTNIIEIIGDTKLRKVKFDTGKELELDGLFVEIGRVAQTEMVKDLGITMNEKNEIKIDRMSKTNIEGFYAAGDVTDSEWKQAITGVAEGVKAAYSAYNYIKTLISQ